MLRFIIALIVMFILAGCYGDLDPCTFDKSVPACDLSRSKAEATIGAINADAALRATQSSIYLRAEQTKSAISADATRQVVKAEATQSAMNTEATRQAIAAVQAQSAVIYRSTQTFADGEATKVAVGVSGAIERARIERDAMPANSTFNVVVFWFLLPALAVLGVIVLGRRTIEASTQALHKRAAMITYGPANNPQLAFVTFDPRSGHPVRFVTSEGLIGPTANLLTGATALNELALPEPLKLAALMEASKRSQAARIAAATGSAPWTVTHSTVVDNTAPLAVPEPIAPAAVVLPRIPTFAELLRDWHPNTDRMLLGIGHDGTPRYCGLDDLLSTGIIGRPGTGKSTVLRFHYLQCKLVGARVVVWDLHRTIVRSLPGAEAFTRIEEIDRSAAEMCALLDRRINNDRYDDQPIMLLADEFNLLAPNSSAVTEAMGRIILEGRKVRMYAMISGQGLPAKLFGDSTPRDALSSRFVLHTTTRQASMIGLDRDSLPLVLNLPRGAAVVDGPIDPEVLSIPNTTESDILSLLPASAASSRATSGAASRATSGPLPFDEVMVSGPLPPEAGKAAETSKKEGVEAGDIDYFDGVEAAENTARQALVRRMMLDGKSQREMIAEIWGQTGGRGYQEAARELSAIQRGLIQ
jgi:hypothetical protein